MASQLVPYHPEMRLGQGFNSFTQQICIDDAVLVDPDRVQDGLNRGHMSIKDISLAIRPPDYGRAATKPRPPIVRQQKTKKRPANIPVVKLDDPGLTRPDWIERARKNSSSSSSSISSNKGSSSRGSSRSVTPFSSSSSISSTSSFGSRGTSTEVPRSPPPFGLTSPRIFSPRSPEPTHSKFGMTEISIRRGEPVSKGDWCSTTDGSIPSQDVRYVARFVKNMSDITEDMNISGARSIKRGRIDSIGGDAFIDTEKFKQADLNFYVRVRVINNFVNVRHALQFNPDWVVIPDEFTECFGDTFVSGFVEGGELNALLSIKVLDRSKIQEVEAGIKAAFGKSLFALDTMGKEEWERRGIDNVTEISLSAVWSGGGSIKSSEKQWPIHSLMEMASGFPDIVGNDPYRTHAVITPYPYLKSFYQNGELLIPHSPYSYAVRRTKTLLDGYLEYKSIRMRLTEDIQQIKSGEKVFQAKDFYRTITSPLKRDMSSVDDDSKFLPTVDELETAYHVAGSQMKRITNEVEILIRSPTAAIDTRVNATFQNPDVFRSRLPKMLPKAVKTLSPRSAVVVQSNESDVFLVSDVGKKANMTNGTFVPRLTSERTHYAGNFSFKKEVGESSGHIVTRVQTNGSEPLPPRLFTGLRQFSASEGAFKDPSLRFRLYSTNETSRGFDACFHDWSSQGVDNGSLDVLALSRSNHNFLTGAIEGRGIREWSIKFPRPFRKAPEIVVWLTGVDFHKTQKPSIDLEVRAVTGQGFRLLPKIPNQDIWVSFSWMAYLPDSGVMSGFLELGGHQHDHTQTGKVSFPPGSFSQRPRVLAALHSISLPSSGGDEVKTTKDENESAGKRKCSIGTDIERTTQDGFNWTFNSTVPKGCKVVMQWVAVA